jgi:hypothetical protein
MASPAVIDKRKRSGLQGKAPSVPPAAYSIAEFCSAHRISVDHYFALQRKGEGPKVMKAGARTLISVESAEAWRRAREAASAAAE